MRCLLFLLLSVSVAWWDIGHILTAEIARRRLEPTQRDQLDALLALEGGFYPYTSTISYAAIWMDDIRTSIDAFGPWHYINWPYCNGTLPEANCSATYGVPSVTILTQLVSMSNTLGIHANTTSDPWTKSFSLRILLHLVGDLHQPFHNVGLFTPQFPTGDAGGNGFKVFYNASGLIINNAHALFDSVAGLFGEQMPKPLTAEYSTMIADEATAIMEEFPASNYSDLYPNATDRSSVFYYNWSREGYAIAVTKGYDLMQFNSTLEESYVELLRPLLKERIAIGGYRLAYLLSRANLTITGDVPSYPPATEEAKPTATIVVGVIGLVLVVVAFVVGMRVQRSRSHRPIFPMAEE